MFLKKPFAGILACMAATVLLAAPAFAHCGHGNGHGHGRRYQSQAQSYSAEIPLCTLEDCTTAGRHLHDNILYCGYPHAGGVCGGDCCALCSVEGCTQTGRHLHDGTLYCQHAHSGGFCDHSCAAGNQ